MQATHVLSNIPLEIQQIFNIGDQVLVKSDDSVNGGHFTLMNNEGKLVEADAVEFFSQDIDIEQLPIGIPLEKTLSHKEYIEKIIHMLGKERVNQEMVWYKLGTFSSAKLIGMFYDVKNLYERVKEFVGIID